MLVAGVSWMGWAGWRPLSYWLWLLLLLLHLCLVLWWLPDSVAGRKLQFTTFLCFIITVFQVKHLSLHEQCCNIPLLWISALFFHQNQKIRSTDDWVEQLIGNNIVVSCVHCCVMTHCTTLGFTPCCFHKYTAHTGVELGWGSPHSPPCVSKLQLLRSDAAMDRNKILKKKMSVIFFGSS